MINKTTTFVQQLKTGFLAPFPPYFLEVKYEATTFLILSWDLWNTLKLFTG